MTHHPVRLCCATLASLFIVSEQAPAQSYPVKPVRIFTGSGPGGGSDLTSRAIAERLS